MVDELGSRCKVPEFDSLFERICLCAFSRRWHLLYAHAPSHKGANLSAEIYYSTKEPGGTLRLALKAPRQGMPLHRERLREIN